MFLLMDNDESLQKALILYIRAHPKPTTVTSAAGTAAEGQKMPEDFSNQHVSSVS